MNEANPFDEAVLSALRQQFLWDGFSIWATGRPGPGEFSGVAGARSVGYRVFDGTLDLLRMLERLLDRMQTPQETHQTRMFARTHRQRELLQKRRMQMNNQDEQRQTTEPESMPTFVVHVRFRQNATWQGTIQWMEAKETRSFRSALELLNLMEEAMVTTSGGQMTTWERGEDSGYETDTESK